MADHLSNASRWTLAGDDVEITVGVIHTDAGLSVLLELENVASTRRVTGRYAPIQADGLLTSADVDILIARLRVAKQALDAASG